MRREQALIGVVAGLAGGLLVPVGAGADAGAGPPSEATLPLGRSLYLTHCANCHGADLEGQPSWKERLPSGRLPAPPHDASGHTWHHPDRALFEVTKRGPAAVVGSGYQNDMPGFGEVLSDGEIWAVLDYIKSRWPERERRAQAERSEADRQ